MKPEMSTAVMIERLRALASESQDSVLLRSVASRIELLLAAESGMSCEMACIRHALDIPPDQSVQPGVVDAFVRLNAKIQDLSEQLAGLRGLVPYAYAYQYAGCQTCEGFQDWRSELSKDRPPEWMLEDGKVTDLIELFARAVPPAISQKITVTDDMAMAFHRATTDGDVGSDDVSDIKIGLGAALCNISTAQTYTVPEKMPHEVMALIESSADKLFDDDDAQEIWNACRGAMLAVAPKLDRKDGDAVSRELMARGVEQAASGFHEKAFVAFEGSNEPGLYIRAQLQLLAQQLRDGDA
ncbi:hypothetical protein EXT62_19780 [Pectobacterium carotovorum subsp. carotovorum]|nr:hypothetical protein [Pectobacterium carotovorum]MCL6399103.1 hypothetical protein [Pectobacterium carotovorum subsp. carotovorum]